jgi:hypothetical protein
VYQEFVVEVEIDIVDPEAGEFVCLYVELDARAKVSAPHTSITRCLIAVFPPVVSAFIYTSYLVNDAAWLILIG